MLEESVAAVPITFIVKHVLFVILSVSNLRVTATAQPVATTQTSSSMIASSSTSIATSSTSMAGIIVAVVYAVTVVNATMVPISG